MASTIDPTKPAAGAATTLSVRNNFLAAKNEIESLQTEVATKQAALVSGSNIKTINGASVLGTGDIAIAGGGVTDHGALSGLGDDDHTQYLNNARGDLRYSALGHAHAVAHVTGLQADLDGKQAALVSATNIKTINGTSILGAGDIVISGGGGGGASVVTSDTPPASPAAGDLWVRTTDMALLTYFNDGTSSQWVVLGGAVPSEVWAMPVVSSLPSPLAGKVLLSALVLPDQQLTPEAMVAATHIDGSICDASSQFDANQAVWQAIGTTGVGNGWLSALGGPPHWIRYRFPPGATVAPKYYKLRPWDTDSFPSRSPKDWTFQGSNDGTNWTTLDTRTGFNSWAIGQLATFTIASPQTFNQFRLYITSNVGGDGGAYTGLRRWAMYGDEEKIYKVTSSGVIKLLG